MNRDCFWTRTVYAAGTEKAEHNNNWPNYVLV